MNYKYKKKLLRTVGQFIPIWIVFLYKETSRASYVNILTRIKALINGFNSNSYSIYEFDKNDIHNYLSNYNRLKTKRINGDYSYLLDNKLVFEKLFADKLNVPKNFSYIINGALNPLDKILILNSIDKIYTFLKDGNKLIFKPVDRGGGEGVFLLQKKLKRIFINDNPISKKELFFFIRNLNDYLVTEYVVQANYSKKIYSESVNSIRILTIQDAKTNIKPQIVAAVHRFGTKKSVPTDNWTQGGLSFDIDINTGKILGGARINGGAIDRIRSHPDTYKTISGKLIPGWKNICTSLINSLGDFPILKYVGWDVVVANNGFYVLEANNYSDINIFQVHSGLLKNDNLRKFFYSHDILQAE